MDIQEAAEERKEQRKKVVLRAKRTVLSLENQFERERSKMKQSEENLVVTQNRMIQSVQEAIRLLKELEEGIKTQITELTEETQKEHVTRVEYFQSFINQLNSSIKYDEGVLQRNNCFEILQAENDAFSLREAHLGYLSFRSLFLQLWEIDSNEERLSEKLKQFGLGKAIRKIRHILRKLESEIDW